MQNKSKKPGWKYWPIVTGLFVAAVVVVVVGFLVRLDFSEDSSDTSMTTASNAVSDEKIYTLSTSSVTAIDFSDNQEMAENSQYIAVVKVDSIDGVDNYSQLNNEYVLPYSYGKMTVVRNVVGDLPVGEALTFYRLGGAIDVDKYYKSLSDTEKERFDYAKENDIALASAEKIQIVDEDDINIEAGKMYLVYLVDERACYGEKGTYAIIGYKGGLREIQSSQSARIQTLATSDIKVLNNYTGEWENLAEIVPFSK